MAVGLFWNERLNFDMDRYSNRFFWVGDNTGNLAYIRALRQALDPVILPILDVDLDVFTDRPDITHYVVTELIWVTERTTYPHVWKMLRAIGEKPLIPISVGVQCQTQSMDVRLHPDTVRLLREMAERATLGVRGEYTASVLERNGILNLRIIGCPSLYEGMNDHFRLEKKPFSPSMRAAASFRTFFGRLSGAECEFLTFAANHQMGFVEQTDYTLTPRMVYENLPQYNYLRTWLEKEQRVFFRAEDWDAWIRGYDFSMGGRFHGNVMAVMNGVPALLLTVDARMNEMARHFHLPALPMSAFRLDKPLEYYYDLADYTDFNRFYPVRLAEFRDFLRENGLMEAKRAS